MWSLVWHSQKAVGLAQPPTSSGPFLDGEEKERRCATCLACDKLLSLLSWLKTSFSLRFCMFGWWLTSGNMPSLRSLHFVHFRLCYASIRFWWDNFDWPLHAEERDLIAVKQGRGPKSLPTIGSTVVSCHSFLKIHACTAKMKEKHMTNQLPLLWIKMGHACSCEISRFLVFQIKTDARCLRTAMTNDFWD